jgi:3-methyladenine DNA glycosylase AlkD
MPANKTSTSSPGTVRSILREIRALGSLQNVEGMARYGIVSAKAYGVSAPDLMHMAREIGRNHELAEELWLTGVLEARILATLIDEPARVTAQQMERWARDLDNWAIVDACCGRLFDKTPFAYRKAEEWSRRMEEFVKRAGFSLMAALAVHDKPAPDSAFLRFLPLIRRESTDERNMVKKAANWALRQIGKRNSALNKAAIQTAEEIRRKDSRSARWIAADALRELRSEAVQQRLMHRG